MRIFVIFFIVFFCIQSKVISEDIKDFEIDGISVGNSLFDHFNETEINSSLETPYFYPNSKKFKIITFRAINNESYERYDIHIKNNDNNYIIYSIKGGNKLSFEKCLTKKKSVVKDIGQIFSNIEKQDYEDGFGDAYGNSVAYITDFKLTDGRIRVWCADYDQNHAKVKANGWYDGLWVNISSKEQMSFLMNEAYK